MFEKITSFQNSKVKEIKKLRERRERERNQLFVIDDNRDLQRALNQGYKAHYAFYCPALPGETQPILQQLQDIPVYEVSSEIMEKASYRENPSSLVAVMGYPPEQQLAGLDSDQVPLILGLVNLQKPGNIGALLRTADAAGVNAILLIDTLLDLYNPNIIRSSTGACFLQNIYSVNSQQTLEFIRANGYTTVAAVVDGDKSLFEANFRQKSVILLGTEDEGLDSIWVQAADERVKIPMQGVLSDSLNVSVSGAIFMYEALRQRQHIS